MEILQVALKLYVIWNLFYFISHNNADENTNNYSEDYIHANETPLYSSNGNVMHRFLFSDKKKIKWFSLTKRQKYIFT